MLKVRNNREFISKASSKLHNNDYVFYYFHCTGFSS